MPDPRDERRKYRRYDTEVKIYFTVTYDITTKVRYQLVNKDAQVVSDKYSALSKNVSAEGLCFVTDHKLDSGDMLYIEVYLPQSQEGIKMIGEVRWCDSIPGNGENKFRAGIKVLTVDGKDVGETISFDKEHKIAWSIVLESVLGNFRKFAEKRKKG